MTQKKESLHHFRVFIYTRPLLIALILFVAVGPLLLAFAKFARNQSESGRTNTNGKKDVKLVEMALNTSSVLDVGRDNLAIFSDILSRLDSTAEGYMSVRKVQAQYSKEDLPSLKLVLSNNSMSQYWMKVLKAIVIIDNSEDAFRVLTNHVKTRNTILENSDSRGSMVAAVTLNIPSSVFLLHYLPKSMTDDFLLEISHENGAEDFLREWKGANLPHTVGFTDLQIGLRNSAIYALAINDDTNLMETFFAELQITRLESPQDERVYAWRQEVLGFRDMIKEAGKEQGLELYLTGDIVDKMELLSPYMEKYNM